MKTWFITGAGNGIGKSIAEVILQNHMSDTLVLISRNLSWCDDLDEEIAKRIHSLQVDLMDDQSYQIITEYLKRNKITLDYVINNAGILVNKPFQLMTMTDIQKQIQVNLVAPIRIIQSTARLFNHGFRVLNISSMGGVHGSAKYPGLSVYSAAKSALIALTECLVVEDFQNKGTFNAVALGATNTRMLQNAFPGYQAELNPEHAAQYIIHLAITVCGYTNGKTFQLSNSNP